MAAGGAVLNCRPQEWPILEKYGLLLEKKAQLLTEHPGCLWEGRLVCHSGSEMCSPTRGKGWPDYRGRPGSRKGKLWDRAGTSGTDWERLRRGAGKRSAPSRSLARSCTCSGWTSKQACKQGEKNPFKHKQLSRSWNLHTLISQTCFGFVVKGLNKPAYIMKKRFFLIF